MHIIHVYTYIITYYYIYIYIYIITCYKEDNLSNKRTEILGTCRHRNKYKLKTATQKTDVMYQSHNVIKNTITLA